jgi:hypothetical protein
MGLFRNLINEARNTSVPTEYRIALGQLKRMYNKGEVPSEKELQKDAEMIAKKNHLEEDKFLEFAKSQFKINESEKMVTALVQEILSEAKKEFDKDATPEDKANAIMKRCKAFRTDSTVGHLLNDADIIQGISDTTKWSFKDSEKYFKDNYKSIKMNEAKSKEDLINYYEKNLKNVEKEYSTDSRKQEYIDYAKGQLAAVKKDGTNGLIKFLKDWNLNESAVGTPGRTTVKDAEEHINDELVAEFKKIIKKLGGKTVAKVLLDKLGQKAEIKDEIEHIEDIIDNSNY